MREPMTCFDRVLLVFIYATSAVIAVFLIWMFFHFTVPWIVDRIQEYIDRRTAITWTIGIVQDGVEPVKLVRNGYTMYVWE